jgi:hypothetical protein
VAGDIHREILQYEADEGELRGNTIWPKCAWRRCSSKEEEAAMLLHDSDEGTADSDALGSQTVVEYEGGHWRLRLDENSRRGKEHDDGARGDFLC